jgi:circadian clock protein KaiC
MGLPGSGKTILANQLCFNHIDIDDGRCVYVTLAVESHAKMVAHLSSLSFWKQERIPDQLYYVSGYNALKKEGLPGLLELIRRTIRERKATLLVVDGLESAEQFAPDARSFREFVHELQGFTSLLACTTLLLTNIRDKSHQENGVVDGIIELSDRLVGPRAVRELTVHKFRGSDYLRGKHEVEIDERGMSIHPRTEVQFDKPPGSATEERVRMAFGIPKLDEMMHGGLLSGSATALLGAPGTGKTLLGLSFLVEGAKNGQQGVYFGFYEPPPRLIEKASRVGIELAKYIEEGLIEIIWQPPLEHYMDSLAEQLLEKLHEKKDRRRRLFIDGIEGFRAAAVYDDRLPRFLSAFTNQLRTLDVTTVVTEELELFKPEVNMPNPELANVVENVVLLRYVELRSQLYRLLSIMKMRESQYDTSIREFKITDQGVAVESSFESADAILSGFARAATGEWARPRAEGKAGGEGKS